MSNTATTPAANITVGTVVLTDRGRRTVDYIVVGHDARIYFYAKRGIHIWGGSPADTLWVAA